MRWKMRLAALVIAISCTANPALAAPFSNGSFESPPILSGFGPVIFFGGSTLGPWTVTGSTIAQGRTGAVYQGQVFTVFEGDHGLDLTGRESERGGGVEQSFDVLPSRRYRLSFAVGRFSSTLPTVGGISTVGVRLSGIDLGVFVNDLISSSYTWQAHSLEFNTGAAQTSATLRFFDSNTGAPTVHVGLDGVTVELLPQSVPMLGFWGVLSLTLLLCRTLWLAAK